MPPSSCTYIVDTLDARQDATAAVPNVREWRAGALPAGVTLTLVHEEPFGVTPDAHVLARLLALPAWAMQALGVRPAQPLGSVAVWRVVTSSA